MGFQLISLKSIEMLNLCKIDPNFLFANIIHISIHTTYMYYMSYGYGVRSVLKKHC